LAQPNREEALATLAEGQSLMAKLLSELTEEQFTRRASIGGGAWSAKVLLGHIALVEEIAVETLDAWRLGEEPQIEQTFTAGGVDAQNAWNEKRKAAWSAERVRSQAEDVHGRLVTEIGAMSDEEWRSKAPYATGRRKRLVTELGSVLGTPKQPFGHAFAHLPDLEAYVRSARNAPA
jgi:uncharacterized damage-inducible protein DinB